MAHGSSRLRRTKRMLILDPFLVSDGCQVQPVTRYCVATILNQTLTVSRPTLHLRVLFVTEWQLETHDRFLQGLGFFFFFSLFFFAPLLFRRSLLASQRKHQRRFSSYLQLPWQAIGKPSNLGVANARLCHSSSTWALGSLCGYGSATEVVVTDAECNFLAESIFCAAPPSRVILVHDRLSSSTRWSSHSARLGSI